MGLKNSCYLIVVQGVLDSSWTDWLHGFEIVALPQATLLVGKVADQAALYGVLAVIKKVGLELLFVQKLSH
jgi:hypothetical protein